MKKRLLVLFFIGAGLVYLSSCKKDKSESLFDDKAFPKEQNVEADKADMEDNAQLAVAELNNFADEQGLEAVNSFADLLSKAGSETAYPPEANNNLVFSTVFKLKSAALKTDSREVFRSINTFMLEDPQSFKEVWDTLKGVYTWNPQINDWNKTNSSTVAEFHFPAKKDGLTNNAVFTISSYKGVVITTPIPDYAGDLPVEVKANLKVDNVEYFAYSLTAAYSNQGIPTSVITKVSFRAFVFTFEFTNTTSKVAVNYKFENGTKTIFDIGAGVNGNFSQQNIENAQSVEQVLQTANAHFQLFNVKIAGFIDVVKLSQAGNNIYANEDEINFDNVKADSLMAIEMNKNAKLIAFFVDTQQKIANIEAYSYADTETHLEWVYNYDTYQYVQVSRRDSYMDLRLVFANGSPSNADNYFGAGFSGLVADINSLLADLNTKFGSDFTPIEY